MSSVKTNDEILADFMRSVPGKLITEHVTNMLPYIRANVYYNIYETEGPGADYFYDSDEENNGTRESNRVRRLIIIEALLNRNSTYDCLEVLMQNGYRFIPFTENETWRIKCYKDSKRELARFLAKYNQFDFYLMVRSVSIIDYDYDTCFVLMRSIANNDIDLVQLKNYICYVKQSNQRTYYKTIILIFTDLIAEYMGIAEHFWKIHVSDNHMCDDNIFIKEILTFII